MDPKAETSAMLWTGGKDSSLALYEANKSGCTIKTLVTFVPPNPNFLCHPISVMKRQADALLLPHKTIEVTQPIKQKYVNAVKSLKKELGITTLITGDLGAISGHINWIRECCEEADLKVITPLWGQRGSQIIKKLLRLKFTAVFSCVKAPWFDSDWLGSKLDSSTFEKLLSLSERTGIDICGEQGEYHTIILEGPIFQKNIRIDASQRRQKGPLMYLDVQELSLVSK